MFRCCRMSRRGSSGLCIACLHDAPARFDRIRQASTASRTSRVPKILPHLMLPADCDYSIWIDGNFQLARPASQIVNEELRFDDWAAHMHPCRGCVYEEGEVLIHEATTKPHEWPHLDIREVRMEMDRYRTAGYPAKQANLTANGLIVRRHSASVSALNEEWWRLFLIGCGRDQLSLPVATWRHQRRDCATTVNRMKHYHDIYNSPLIKFGWHAAWKDKPDNVAYRLERERIAARVENLREVVGDGGYRWKVY